MIDENKLITELEKLKQEVNMPSDIVWNNLLKVCIDTVNEQPKVGDWIPVSKRLPEENKNSEYYDSVIVTLDDGRVACGCYRNRDKEWWVDAEDGEKYSINATGHVVAWVPLPESYKEEKERKCLV